jgi:enamine deaminase RidA (YjgF/YER057c/UK114 family)
MRHVLRDGGGFEDVAAYSRAVRVGRRIVTSGTAALDSHGVALHPRDAYAQTRDAIAAAVAAVIGLGGTIHDVTRTRVYLAAGTDWRAAVSAHQQAFVGINPANTTVFVQALIPEGALVEVELEAEVVEAPREDAPGEDD